jgi:hypothetical protein
MKFFMLVCLVGCFINNAQAQDDFLILRKKNITQQIFFVGQQVQFEITGAGWVSGTLKKIRNDSVFIEMNYTKQVANYWGLPTVTTISLGIGKFSIQNIKAIPIKRRHESMFANGTFLTFASGAYILLNIVNGIIKSEPIFQGQNLTNLAIATGALGIGTLQVLTRKDKYIIGKKYTLHTTATLQ